MAVSQACNMLVPVGTGEFLAVEDAKGRGVILSGGEFEGSPTGRHVDGRRNSTETYIDCALRGLREETGLVMKQRGLADPNLLFSSMNVDGWYVFTFLALPLRRTDVAHLVGADNGSGRVVLTDRPTLLCSAYRAYYELVLDAYDSRDWPA